jgi:1-acyl-sn-glycerol-3-phosphate acyltransferase
MSETEAAKTNSGTLSARQSGQSPTRQEMAVLDVSEKIGFRLVHRMNRGGWKTLWTFCQRHIGSLWIFLSTYNLMNVRGLENFENMDVTRPLLLVSNHRSFFDMYTVSSVLFRRTKRPIRLYFPVRAKFFYDSPVGWFVNLVMGWWAMYPPFFREAGNAEKREFDKFSLRKLIELSTSGEGNVIGFHPEGKRNLNDDPYSFLPAQPGIGKVIYEAKPQVLPVFIAGLNNDLPKQILGNWFGGEKVRIRFGEAVELDKFYAMRDSVRTHKAIADHLMEKIAVLAEDDRREFGNSSDEQGEDDNER